jgi:MFS family permease
MEFTPVTDGNNRLMSRTTVTLLVLCGTQFLLVLDVSIVAVALPDIRGSLGFTPEDLQWVISAYALAFGGLLVAAGRVADVTGPRRVFATGVVGFGAASLACAIAPTAALLVAGRAVQGVAAAVQTPAALALLTATFSEPAERRRAVGWWTAAAAGGGASGWVLGGVLVEAFGWPAVFLVNVPLCALAAVAIPRVLREQPRERRGRLDLGAALAVTAALGLLVLGLTGEPAALAGAAAAFAAFALLERRSAEPMLPPWALRRPAFGTAVGVALANTGVTTAAMFLAILYQQETLGRGPLEAGLWCVPFNLAVIAGSLLGPRARWSARAAMSGGLVTMAVGALTLLAQTPVALLPAFLLMGAGLGVSAVASTASGTAALDDSAQGIASGVLNAAAQIGTALGLAISVPLGFDGGWIAAAAIGLAAAAATRSFLPSRRRPTTPRP